MSEERRNDLAQKVRYGQVCIGPPGSGKTTYCNGMQQFLQAVNRNPCLVLNLDPANDNLHNNMFITEEDERDKDLILDISEEVINAGNVMNELGLGPNGALMYSMEYIDSHFDEILDEIIIPRVCKLENERDGRCTYFLVDVPGQVEIFTHCKYLMNIVRKLGDALNVRFCSVQLIDAHHCTDSYKFIGSVLLALTTMLRLELPAVNLLSKMDLLAKAGPENMPFNLEYFLNTDVFELTRLLDYLDGGAMDANELNGNQVIYDENDWADDPEYQAARSKLRNGRLYSKHRRLQKSLCEVIEDFSLVSFLPLDIQNAESVGRALAKIDKCNGYVFGLEEIKNKDGKRISELFKCASQELDGELAFERNMGVQERYLGGSLGGNLSDDKMKSKDDK